ncbi:hydrogenase nickel incorporation protein HypB [Chloroflexota bacterium]
MTVKLITIKEDILGANEEKAEKNRKLLDKNGILMVNIMSSPGSGKTSLILQTISNIKKKARIAVIEGDIASTIDADKVSEQGIPAVQINTGGGCHLDANMIEQALDNLPLENIDLVFIENVGNLICPAEFALGDHRRVMLLSTPEGDDKPYKYPIMFSDADVVLLNKIDLSPLLDFDVDSFTSAVKGLNSKAKIFQVSCKTGQGLEEWFSWLESQMESRSS